MTDVQSTSLKDAQLNPVIATLEPHSNRPSHSNTVIGTLAIDGWAVTFGTARRELGGATALSGPSSLYQMYERSHQRPVYQLRITWYSTMRKRGYI